MMPSKLFLRVKPLFKNSKYSTSALYITGDKASKHFAVLSPYIDFNDILNNKEQFINNVKSRLLDLDLNKVIERYDFYQNMEAHRTKLELTRSEIGKHITKLMKTETPNLKEIEKWKLKSKIVKGDLNNLKDSYYSVKEAVNLQILSLPNILHNKTPISEEIIHQVHKKPEKIDKSHLQIADSSIHYINPYNCYLKEDPALFELSVLNYLRKKLLKLNFTQFSSPDFSRSVIVEGCGKKFDDSTTFTIDEPHEKFNSLSRLHLTGGSSIESFMCYFARHLVDFNKLPLKIFSTGRKYQPYNENLPFDLFNLSQGSVLNVFIAYLDKEDEIINKLQDLIVDFYDSLGYHFMLTLIPASKLTLPESLRFSVKMYSNYTEKYIEVANISLYDEYLSKRLLFTTNINKERVFPKIISGELINVPKLLGCAIENDFVNSKPLLCDLLRKYLFSYVYK